MRCSYNVNATMDPSRVMDTQEFKLDCSVILEDPTTNIHHLSRKTYKWHRNIDDATCV